MPSPQPRKNRRPASIESRIAEHYEQLSEIDQRLADVILSSPGQLAMQTATELAANARVSKATATRFFQKLGYASYDDARETARAALVGGSPLYLQERGNKESGGALDEVIEAHLNHEVTNLANTYRSLDRQVLADVVSSIASARRVVVIGYRHSHTIAMMIRRELVQVRSDVIVLPTPGDTLAEYVGDLGGKDLAIVIGFRRRVPAVSLAVAALADAGVDTLYLSDVIAGKPARLARWVIRCHTDGFMLFDSVIAVSALVNLICSLVAERLREHGNGHLQRVEVLHQRLRELE
ncbi:MurR/RpiR family transcriptional regulator [Paraburkholderia caballeronis]|uniref:DNA-binding transcriptional regulator, MurR/RpiR family, contains HTH and SIS domains n=1 Tax=Paraburkholderia caballeronis TaxID=416943 RepID=A0A1H7LYV4_9BURK|nr:MurR/RpiR family transcriptional regulator [Paraburkholderia caballeronis]PXW28655.1 RpiR family transcriptional regulator [Paraburkholderia caballeronis]PXX04021.1 RpiR family transcriptional regulator [Paraburkholderia caballeronis]RAK04765.1 RpiR family transcriptional regulator [Paraburkholderia caballeronis]SED66069.1 transcriptional regulator, RpiR family [Paraburkholderia caballeronis]SEL04111.1 DNA-binding transcriptional regulator, MurR/RpiR family, contains HTH and SIS domains [Pa